jgi:hypothetical protein
VVTELKRVFFPGLQFQVKPFNSQCSWSRCLCEELVGGLRKLSLTVELLGELLGDCLAISPNYYDEPSAAACI